MPVKKRYVRKKAVLTKRKRKGPMNPMEVEAEENLVIDVQFLLQETMTAKDVDGLGLARRCGWPLSYLRLLQSSEGNPKLKEVARMFHALGVRLIPKLAEEQKLLERDAERWRALMSSERIRMMGCAGFDRADPNETDWKNVRWEPRPGEYLHLGMEFWSEHPAKDDLRFPQDADRALFTRYVDYLRAQKKLKEAEAAGTQTIPLPTPMTQPEVCGLCGIAVRPEGGHRCGECGRDI